MIFMTVPDTETGAKIGKSAVEAGLAACANIIPGLRSIYKWKGKVCDDPEALVIFKTRKSLVKKLEKFCKKLHPYEVPEFISIKIESGSEDYLKWITESTKKN